MPQDPRTIVHTSTMPWSEQVAIVEAQEALDHAGPGEAGIAQLERRMNPVVYEFYGGSVRFRDGKGPYG